MGLVLETPLSVLPGLRARRVSISRVPSAMVRAGHRGRRDPRRKTRRHDGSCCACGLSGRTARAGTVRRFPTGSGSSKTENTR